MRKSPLKMNISERKSYIIQSCFIQMADMDYLTARWAYTNGVFHNFYWSAAQCVEKYAKAALLYNGNSVLNASHNLNQLAERLGQLEPGLFSLPIQMPATSGMGRETWHEKPMSLFVDYLNMYGGPDSRYSLSGTFVNGPVIHPLDEICARLRGFIRTHNFFDDDLFSLSSAAAWPHERVDPILSWMIDVELPLEELFAGRYQVGQTEHLRETFSNMNFSFFSERAASERTFGGQHFSMSPLRNHIIRLREMGDAENTVVVDELRAWVAANIKLPRDLRDAINGVNS